MQNLDICVILLWNDLIGINGGENVSGSPTIFEMSPECKAVIVKKVYEHYMMNILWREICQKFSTLCLLLFPTISYHVGENAKLQLLIVIISVLISVLITLFCGTKKYYESLHIVADVYSTDCNDNFFEYKYRKLLPYIRELDFARGRCDFTKLCEERGVKANISDIVTKHDKNEMNRQRLIIAALCFMVCAICVLMLSFLQMDNIIKMVLLFILISTFVCFVFMVIDCIEKPVFRKREKKKQIQTKVNQEIIM